MKNRFVQKDLVSIIKKARAASRDGGKEICGLLVHNGYLIELHETTNKSPGGGSFIFDPKEIRSLAKSVKVLKHEIIGTFHSHPLAPCIPGPGDIKNALDPSLMLIIDCSDSSVGFWKIAQGKAKRAQYETIGA